jgi:hypothetical protein
MEEQRIVEETLRIDSKSSIGVLAAADEEVEVVGDTDGDYRSRYGRADDEEGTKELRLKQEREGPEEEVEFVLERYRNRGKLDSSLHRNRTNAPPCFDVASEVIDHR